MLVPFRVAKMRVRKWPDLGKRSLIGIRSELDKT